jgi:hypothetical protein
MNKILIFLIVLSFSIANAQVGGLSASKLFTICSETVPKSAIEFEPSFAFSTSRYSWNDSYKMSDNFSNSDSVSVSSAMAFRFSYGLTNNIELGVSVYNGVSLASWGLKYNFYKKEKTLFSLIIGVNTVLGNRTYDIHNLSNSNSIATGFILSKKISEKLSFDADLQYQRYFLDNIIRHQDIFINTDFGYYIFDGIQLVMGLNYFINDGSFRQSSLLILNPGLTIEKATNFILVLQVPYSITGRNSQKTVGFAMALTILID